MRKHNLELTNYIIKYYRIDVSDNVVRKYLLVTHLIIVYDTNVITVIIRTEPANLT